jgi:hypothetical protein
MPRAISGGIPPQPVTSRKASSMEMGSTSGAVASRIAKTCAETAA